MEGINNDAKVTKTRVKYESPMTSAAWSSTVVRNLNKIEISFQIHFILFQTLDSWLVSVELSSKKLTPNF